MRKFMHALLILSLLSQQLALGADVFTGNVQVGGSMAVGKKTAPDAKAIADFVSTSKVLLPPRMTTAQRDAIVSPPPGGVIHNTDTGKLNSYSGVTSTWGEVGSGAGSGGINYLSANPDAEINTAGWSAYKSDAYAILTQGDLTFTAKTAGTGGNSIRVRILTCGGTCADGAVSVSGNDITIDRDPGASLQAATAAALVNAHVTASTMIHAAVSGTGSNIQAAFAYTNLAGGDAGANATPIYGGKTGNSTYYTTQTTPTTTWTRSTSSPHRGLGSFLLTKDAANRIGEGTRYDFTIDAADKGRPIYLSADYSVASGTFTEGDVTYWIWDRTNNTLVQTAPQKLPVPTGSSSPFNAGFVSASNSTSYSLLLHVASTSASAYTLKFDNFIQSPNSAAISQVSQASLVGTLKWPGTASCQWQKTATSFGNFTADTDCGTAVVTGNASQPGTKVPGVTFATLPAGDYFLVARGFMFDLTADTNACYFRMSDGTSSSVQSAVYASNQSNYASAGLTGRFSYTAAQTNVTFQIQARSDNAANTCGIDASTVSEGGLEFDLYRFPSTQEMAYRPDLYNWTVDASMGGSAANPSLGTGNTAAYAELTSASLDLVNNTTAGPNVLTAQIACASGTASTGLTCSSNESVGIAFNLPIAGSVEACAAFTHELDIGGSATPGGVDAVFQIVETTNTSSAIVQEGKDRLDSYSEMTTAGGNRYLSGNPMRVCGTFNFSSAGQKTLRLEFEQSVSGTVGASIIRADRAAAAGQRDIHWTVRPITQNVPAPVLVGGVRVNARKAAGQTFTSDVDITFGTESEDNLSAFDGTTFTAPRPDTYAAAVMAYTDVNSATTSQWFQCYFQTNIGGVSGENGIDVKYGNGASVEKIAHVIKDFKMNTGDTLKVRCGASVSTTLSASTRTHLNIHSVGPH